MVLPSGIDPSWLVADTGEDIVFRRGDRAGTCRKDNARQAGDCQLPTVHVSLGDPRGAQEQDPPQAEFSLQLGLGAGTGGYLWAAGECLACWLLSMRGLLPDLNVIELGCGLGLPSLVAASCGASRVLATDFEAALLDRMDRNSAAAGCRVSQALSTALLDITAAASVRACCRGDWDLVLFTDCILDAYVGAALPHVLHALLWNTQGSQQRRAVAIGVLPNTKRPGEAAFWATLEASAALAWTRRDGEACGKAPALGQHTGAYRKYVFWLREGAEPPDLEQALGDPEAELVEVVPLFDGI